MKKKYCSILTLVFTLVSFFFSPAFGRNSQEGQEGQDIQSASNPDRTDQEAETGWRDDLPKEKKALYTNVFAVSFITLYGFADWDYGSDGFHFANEGWFEKETKYGGADKMGHFWSTYVLADTFT
ncbi:MAG: DUF2279 domain-containing protein, partial [Candidatus Electrothrix sp. AUS1_2]|nr:DUF2279 domain-containing protein [Candidatus Electrothrix sp. AUS1_2]